MRFHPNCNYVATGSADQTMRLWDVQTADCVRLFLGHSSTSAGGGGGAVGSTVSCVAFSADGRLAASGAEDGKVMVWDLGSGKRVHSALVGHQKGVTCLEFSADGNLLATGGMDHSVRLWDLKK